MPHNLVIVKPGAENEIGLAATNMAADPKAVERGQYVPRSDKVLFHTRMVQPSTTGALRFIAPRKPGEYPYLCTYPGHWLIMRGIMIVK